MRAEEISGCLSDQQKGSLLGKVEAYNFSVTLRGSDDCLIGDTIHLIRFGELTDIGMEVRNHLINSNEENQK
jgi:hypothetical protein